MQGDWFLDLFTAEAEKLVEVLSRERGSSPQIPTPWWSEGLPEPSTDVVAAAVDGGAALQPMVGGGAVYLVRAFGYVQGAPPERGLELKVLPVRDGRVLDAMRTWVEHRVASKVAARLEKGSVLLMDGSLWAIVTACMTQLARVAMGRVSSLSSVYLALYSAKLLTSVADLVNLSHRKGITLAYVSKDHGFRVLKEKVLLDLVAEAMPEHRDVLERALAYYPLAFREKLMSIAKHAPPHVHKLMASALDPCYRDPAFLLDVVGDSVGYTWVIRIPPPSRVASFVLQLGLRRTVEVACEKVLEVASEREADACHDVDRLVRALSRLPLVRAFYLKLSPNDHPLLIEIPDPASTYFTLQRVLEPPQTTVKSLVAVLARDYGGPGYYNVPLVVAHMHASVRGAQMEGYMKLLESLAAAKGVRLNFSRRWAMRRLTLGKPRRFGVRGFL